ncbi:hypothetical protein L484_000404 [Morus notabilis]|uniref:Uncharacterized protein n=1 Tax=Morus notabilis TaxID=981085 RepID=W9SEM0_9ROSA|nr:hypothetical protein L484_000404 [Morus notabilis]
MEYREAFCEDSLSSAKSDIRYDTTRTLSHMYLGYVFSSFVSERTRVVSIFYTERESHLPPSRQNAAAKGTESEQAWLEDLVLTT